MNRFVTWTSLVCSLAMWVGTTQASLINVDLGGTGATGSTQTGAAAIGQNGDYWNAPTFATGTLALLNAGSSSTGVTMTVSGSSVFTYDGAATSPFNNTNVYSLMRDYLLATAASGNTGTLGATNITVSLTGLTAGSYKLYAYDEGSNIVLYRTDSITVATSVGTSSVTVGPATANGTANGSLVEGVNYGVFDCTVGSDGALTITVAAFVTSGGNDRPQLNGFQLVSVPEPTSASLTIGGVIGLLVYAWKKRRNAI